MNWEYKVLEWPGAAKNAQNAEVIANRLGAEGWELVGIATPYAEGAHPSCLFFKRPKA